MEWADQMGEETQLHWAANGYNDCWINHGQSIGCAYVDFGCGREEDMGVDFFGLILWVLFFGLFFLGPCLLVRVVIKSNNAATNETQNVMENSMPPPIMQSTMTQQQ